MDLLIRTSDELRISNFLLYQVAYAEMIFPEKRGRTLAFRISGNAWMHLLQEAAGLEAEANDNTDYHGLGLLITLIFALYMGAGCLLSFG